MRKPAAGALRALLIISIAGTASAADAATREPPSFGTFGTRAAQVDRDGDKVFDELESRLRRGSSRDRVDVIVVLRARASVDRVRRLERSVGGFGTGRRFSIIDGFSARMSKRQALALAGDPAVDHVEENSTVRALNDTAQSSFGVTKARIDAPALDGNADANAATYSKDDLVVAVIDTGIDAAHLDLDDGKVIAFKDFVGTGTVPYDDQGHGTHVAAIAAGEGDARPDRLYKGVAPAAALVGIKALDQDGFGTEADLVSAIQWAVQNKAAHGIEVLNLSLGFPGCSDGGDASSLAVNGAHDAGLVVAVAVGNEGPGRCTVNSPGAATKALTVGAMGDVGENGFYQYFASSRGKTVDGRIKPDVSAPGINVTSANVGTPTGYVQATGTSMATPFVAGVASLMLDASPGLSPQQVKDKITASAVDWARGGDNLTAGSSGPDIDYGAGRLDAYAALQSAGATLVAPPLVPTHELREGTLSGTGAQTDYPLNVDDTLFPIAATLIMPTISGGTASSPDFDLHLLDPNGVEVASSEFTTRQEEIGFAPTIAGTYTVRVRSYKGSGPFFVDISIGRTGYARPKSASPLTLKLVPAFDACTTGADGNHGAPLASPSCNPPVQTSPYLTARAPERVPPFVGSADASALIGLKVTCVSDMNPPVENGDTPPCNANTGDQEDLKITNTFTGVRCTGNPGPPAQQMCTGGNGAAGAGTTYNGKLLGLMTLRMTDRLNGPAQANAGTSTDYPFKWGVGCSNGACSSITSADAVIPGLVKEQKRAVWELSQIQVLDGGSDGNLAPAPSPGSGACPPACEGNGGEAVFLRQGLFAP